MMKALPMYIIDVIPTIKIPKSDIQILTYFSQGFLPTGALVMVPLGNQKVNAIVIRATSAQEQKIAIKKSGFQIKGIMKVIAETPVLTAAQMALMKWCAEYYCAPLPLFAKTFLPPYCIKRKTPLYLSPASSHGTVPRSPAKKPLLLAQSDRRNEYMRAIDACLTEGKQAALIAPELAIAQYWARELAAYAPTIMTGELTPKKFFDAWDAVRTGKARCIIGTRTALFSNFADCGLIILDDEHSPHFKSWDMAPQYHARTVAVQLAALSGAQCIMGSAAPSVESYWHAREGDYALSAHHNLPAIAATIVDMRNELRDKNYTTLSYQLRQALEKNITAGKKAILFIARRGSESFLFCPDCSHIETCKNCDAHLVYHIAPRRMLMCHHCGFTADPPAICAQCKSPRLRTFGAGTQKVAHDIAKEFPHARIATLDADTAKTFAAQTAIIEQFRSGTIDILIGTQALLAKPDMPRADCVAVISLDNLLYLPDYTIPGRLYQTVRELRSYCTDTAQFFLQTHTPDNETLRVIAAQAYDAFYAYEIAARKALRYPPFARIVKLTVRDTSRAQAQQEASRIADALAAALKRKNISGDVLGPAPAYIAKVRQYFVYHVIVKMENIDQKTLHAIVVPVAGHATIDVDPEHLL